MDEAAELNPALDRLRRQRAHKRGQVTKLQKKITSLDDSHPDNLDSYTIKGLIKELSAAVTAHDAVQAQINVLLEDVLDAYDAELLDSEKHDELHLQLSNTLDRVSDRCQLWSDSASVVKQMDAMFNVADKTTDAFRSSFVEFRASCKPFLNSSKVHHANPAFKDRLMSLQDACDKMISSTYVFIELHSTRNRTSH